MNLAEALAKERQTELERQQQALLSEARDLAAGIRPRKEHAARKQTEERPAVSLLERKNWDENSLYSQAEIRRVAIHYNLRFLPAKSYRNALPYPVHLKCTALEIELDEAPELFILTDQGNFRAPFAEGEHLVFAAVGENKFFLIASWGKPYPLSRLVLGYPFRSISSVMLTTLVAALLVMLITPTAFITRETAAPYWSLLRLAYYFHLVILFGAILIYYLVGLRRYLNDGAWNRDGFY